MFHSILVLCIGNICRSPLAEVLLAHGLKAAGAEIRVSSAGLGALRDHPAHEIMQEIALGLGLNLEEHRAQQISENLVREAELILVMTENQKNQMHQDFPQSRGKVFLLHNIPAKDIPDPYQKEESDFHTAAALIQTGVNQWVKTLTH